MSLPPASWPLTLKVVSIQVTYVLRGLAQSPRVLPRLVLSSIQRKTHQTSSVTVHLPAQRCRAWTSSFRGQESHSYRNWSSTTPVMPNFLYGSEWWVITFKMDACRINALHQWCLRMLIGIKWYTTQNRSTCTD